MSTEQAVIKVHVENEKDLYEKFDEDQKILNGALVSYLERQHNQNKHGVVPMIRFVTSVPLNKEKLKEALLTTVEQAEENVRVKRRRARWNELYLFLIGLACILLGIVLAEKTGVVYLQLLSLTAGFAIKEAATIQFLTLPKIKLEERRLRFISRGKIEIVETDSKL